MDAVLLNKDSLDKVYKCFYGIKAVKTLLSKNIKNPLLFKKMRELQIMYNSTIINILKSNNINIDDVSRWTINFNEEKIEIIYK